MWVMLKALDLADAPDQLFDLAVLLGEAGMRALIRQFHGLRHCFTGAGIGRLQLREQFAKFVGLCVLILCRHDRSWRARGTSSHGRLRTGEVFATPLCGTGCSARRYSTRIDAIEPA